MGRVLREEAERRERARTLCCFGEVTDFGAGHQRSFSLFPDSTKLSLPCLLLRAIALRVTWKHISRTTVAGCCDTSTKCSLCQQQEEYGNANLGTFFYLPKAQTGHCSFWVWQGRRMGGKPSTCLLPRTAASSVSLQVPPEDISNASRVSRGVKTPHLISKT